MSSSSLYEELDVESVVCCPVCFEVPSNVIYLCKVGHHMCEKCRKKLTLCPTCQSALTGCRNFLAEALISKLSILKNDIDADTNDNAAAEQRQNTAAAPMLQEINTPLKGLPMPPGEYRCLLETCPNRGTRSVGDLYSHFEKLHLHLYEKFPNKTVTFKHNFDNFCLTGKGKRKYHRAFHVSNMGLFYLLLNITEDNHFNCWLSKPAPVKLTNRFDYEVVFTQEENNDKEYFISKVASNLQEPQWLLERGRVFVLPPDKHRLENNKFFSLKIKIVYKAGEKKAQAS